MLNRKASRVSAAQTQIETLETDCHKLNATSGEAGLNADAGQTLASLKSEQEDLTKAQEGHEVGLEAAKEVALAAAGPYMEKRLSAVTEDVARLAARHHRGRYLTDCSRSAQARGRC